MGFKVTVDLQRPNFAKKIFFAHSKAKTLIYSLVKKSNVTLLNDRDFSRKNFFAEELINS